ncbi:ZSWM3 protein, partial [Nycticryphes semicollaris]|nr:ZSWM3 protein [Nycticryphes semicollaris]
MELGTSFRSYKDFRRSFHAFELSQGCRYGLQSCVSVRCYNRQYGTAVRRDVVFMQVKFVCAQTQKYSKTIQQPNLCPAYFVLQYKEDIDRLVISELNDDHVHTNVALSLTRAAAAVAANTMACDGPTTKLYEEQQLGGTGSVAVANEDVQAIAGQTEEVVTALYKAPEAANASMFVRVAEVMKTFLRLSGLQASVSADGNHGLERLSFQTSKMKSSFMQFPKNLLLHRVLSEEGCVLYAFIAESKEQVGKVVHLSLLKEDTGHSVRKMLTVFKEFNPEWQKVQAVFMDITFFHKAILQEVFPSAQVLLSIYHTIRLLKKNVKEAKISSSFKQNLRLALQKAAFGPSAANLDALSQLAKHVVIPELYNYLRANWFSCEPLWSIHTEKGLQFCGLRLDSLDLITCQITSLFGQQPHLEMSVLRFMECIDSLDSQALEIQNWGFLSTGDSQSGLWESLDVCTDAAAEPDPVPGSPTLDKLSRQAAAVEAGSMLALLWNNCVELGCWLCLKEWEVVQTSSQLLSPEPGSLTVLLLENMHRVSQDCRSCTCGFHRRYRLPCRHILAVLQVHRRCVEEGMVCRRWQKRYQQLPVPGAAPPDCGGGLLGGQTEGREERIRSLNLELANLLMQCDGEELEERGSVLATILAAWARSPG